MRYRMIPFLAAVILALTCVLSACGEEQKDNKKETAAETAATQAATAESETTAVLETTADGGTVEQDSEGNKITKDKNGEVIAVVNKSGDPIEVSEYISTHQWVTSPDNKSSDKPAEPSVNKPDDSTLSPGDEEVEGEIPVIVATIPDPDDLIELPDF